MAIAHDGCPGAELRTIVADWETVVDDCGETISPDMLPVVVTVKATSTDEAIQAASDKLQAHYGADVPELFAKGITHDDWFGLNETDPFLRICAVLIGAPAVENDDEMTTVIR